MNKHERMMARIEKHGEALNRIFKTSYQPIELCKKLRRIETKAHRYAEDYCNGFIDAETLNKVEDKLLDRLDEILNFRSKKIPVFINNDPRGYSLKITDSWILKWTLKNKTSFYRDMGGFGILAPNLTEDYLI